MRAIKQSEMRMRQRGEKRERQEGPLSKSHRVKETGRRKRRAGGWRKVRGE